MRSRSASTLAMMRSALGVSAAQHGERRQALEVELKAPPVADLEVQPHRVGETDERVVAIARRELDAPQHRARVTEDGAMRERASELDARVQDLSCGFDIALHEKRPRMPEADECVQHLRRHRLREARWPRRAASSPTSCRRA